MQHEHRIAHAPLLRPGDNCWRLARADRLKLFLSTADYFAALHEALLGARESVTFLAWEIDSRTRLRYDGAPREWPVELGPLLHALVARRPRLEVRLLLWDYHPIYALERESQSLQRLRGAGHPRLQVRLDARHPPCASHHQKLVVIDDQLAFLGGTDPSKRRWDSAEHRPGDPRRTDPDGIAYAPFHDTMALVDGEAARALGRLARDRWRVATCQRPRPSRGRLAPWPAGVRPDLTGCEVALARTLAPYRGRRGVREVERLFLDSIAAARAWIYIETQYLTADGVTAALCRRLEEPHGPEVVIVLPRETGAWLEQTTMDVLRNQVLRNLESADRFGRLRVLYPNVPADEDVPVYVHAKLMIVDRRLLRIGSANLNNRSMGQDSEVDLALEAREAASRALIEATLQRLLAMHLALEPQAVATALRGHDSLVRALDDLAHGRRRLLPLRYDPTALDAIAPALSLVDSRLPFDPARPLRALLRPGRRRRGRRYGVLMLGLLLAGMGVVSAWETPAPAEPAWHEPPPARAPAQPAG